MAVPYVFANATSAIPLSQLDNNFATPVTIGNVAIQLGNTVSTIGNVTLNSPTLNNATAANVTITSVSTPITAAQGGTGNSSAFTANAVVYAPTTSTLATGSALTWNGSSLGVGTNSPNSVVDIVGSGNPTLTLRGSAGAYTAYLKLQAAGGGSSVINATGASSDSLIFQITGTEAMRLTSAGNVGIGTTSPPYKLSVFGSGIHSQQTGGEGTLFLSDGTYQTSIASSSNIIRFVGDAGVERMRIDSSGNLLVGTTTASVALSTGTAFLQQSSAGSYMAIGHQNGSGSGTSYVYFSYNGSGIGSITQSGTTAVLYNVTSDQRLKINIVDAPDGNIDQIKIRSFDWKSDGSHNTYGVIAQELLEIAPYAVHQPENQDEMMGVDYSKLVPMMIKEIQSLKQRIHTLENK